MMNLSIHHSRFFIPSPRGFESPTTSLGGECSIQLSYEDTFRHNTPDYTTIQECCEAFMKN